MFKQIRTCEHVAEGRVENPSTRQKDAEGKEIPNSGLFAQVFTRCHNEAHFICLVPTCFAAVCDGHQKSHLQTAHPALELAPERKSEAVMTEKPLFAPMPEALTPESAKNAEKPIVVPVSDATTETIASGTAWLSSEGKPARA
jgi:hypothetical protein